MTARWITPIDCTGMSMTDDNISMVRSVSTSRAACATSADCERTLTDAVTLAGATVMDTSSMPMSGSNEDTLARTDAVSVSVQVDTSRAMTISNVSSFV